MKRSMSFVSRFADYTWTFLLPKYLIIHLQSSQTDHDFNLERQNLVHAGKQKVQEEYAQKEKDLEIQQRV